MARLLLALVMLAAMAWPGQAQAACQAQGTQGNSWINCSDAGEAASMVRGKVWPAVADCNVRNGRIQDSGGGVVGWAFDYGGDGSIAVCGYLYPTGTVWAQASYLQGCSTRNTTYPLGDAPLNAVPISDCVGGCKVVGEAFTKASGGITLYGMRNRTYVNQACAGASNSNAPIDAPAERQEATKTPPAECSALGGGQTACVKPNGDYCATASTGKTFCWTPGQEGAQVDGEQAQVKGETGKPVTPPDVAIPEKDWQRKEGHQVTECTGAACKTSNVTNFETVPQGQAKNSTQDNKPDGSGNTSGNGKNEEGGKDSATDSGNCETPPMCTGDTLKCLQLKFTWKIECNTKGNEITTGQGCAAGDVPVCAGKSCKAEQYAQLLQQWKQRCALEEIAKGNADRAQGINNGDDAGVVDGIWLTPGNGSPLSLRTDLVQVGNGGSLLPDIELEGQTWTVPAGFYDAIAAVRFVIIAMCTVIAMFVVGRNI